MCSVNTVKVAKRSIHGHNTKLTSYLICFDLQPVHIV